MIDEFHAKALAGVAGGQLVDGHASDKPNPVQVIPWDAP